MIGNINNWSSSPFGLYTFNLGDKARFELLKYSSRYNEDPRNGSGDLFFVKIDSYGYISRCMLGTDLKICDLLNIAEQKCFEVITNN